MELWGESFQSYRCRRGFDRVAPQSTTHIRTVLLHVCRALSYLHRGLGMCHTDVKLDNILIIDKVDCLEKGIECKLADVGSVEEVTAILSPSRAGAVILHTTLEVLNTHLCFQAVAAGLTVTLSSSWPSRFVLSFSCLTRHVHCRVGRHNMTFTVASTVTSLVALCLLGVGMHHLSVRGC